MAPKESQQTAKWSPDGERWLTVWTGLCLKKPKVRTNGSWGEPIDCAEAAGIPDRLIPPLLLVARTACLEKHLPKNIKIEKGLSLRRNINRYVE